VRKIYTQVSEFISVQIVMVEELSDRDMANHSTVAELLIGIVYDDVILMPDEGHFQLFGCINN
jgi:hypothetical protein